MTHKPHTFKELKALIPLLKQAAEMYFNDPRSINTDNGICYVLEDILNPTRDRWDCCDRPAYDMMDDLMRYMGEPHEVYTVYTDTPESWEPRAYMCLFLAEYLKGTQ